MGQHRCQPLPPRVAPTKAGMETPRPHAASPLQCTHPHLLPGQHQRGSAGTRGAGETLGGNDNAGDTGCCP